MTDEPKKIEEPVSVGDDHKTHAWGKWRPIGGLFSGGEYQQRNCVICGFADRVSITRGSR